MKFGVPEDISCFEGYLMQKKKKKKKANPP